MTLSAGTPAGDADVVVVGGGIVGLATAATLAERGRTVVVLEKETAIGRHQTGHNSGVVHSGLYYRPGSEKARTVAAGRRALLDLCAEAGVAIERCGKLVVASDPSELPALDELERRGRANGVALERLAGAAIAEHEPHTVGVAALHVPEAAIVDFGAVARALARRLAERGGRVVTGAEVGAVHRDGRDVVVVTPAGEARGRLLVGCAGLQSDRLARLAGLEPGVRILPFRGEYQEVVPERCHLVRHLVYPVPDPRFPFLGVHFTRTIDGRLEAGPNAVVAWRREGYDGGFDRRDATSLLAYPGSWRLAARYWRTGLGEMARAWSRARFATALRRLVPELRDDDLRPGGCGIRAQAVDRQGRLADDFRFAEDDRSVHVVNAPSPAATASLAIARVVADRVEARLG